MKTSKSLIISLSLMLEMFIVASILLRGNDSIEWVVIATLLATVLPIFINNLQGQIKADKAKVIPVLKSIAIGIALFIFITLISAVLPISGVSNTTNTITNEKSVLVSILFPLLLAPISEELLFRGAMRASFNDENKVLYVIVSSVLFGLVHLQDITPLGIFFFLASAFSGAIFSIIYLKTDNIVYPIVSHVSYNAITLLIVLLAA